MLQIQFIVSCVKCHTVDIGIMIVQSLIINNQAYNYLNKSINDSNSNAIHKPQDNRPSRADLLAPCAASTRTAQGGSSHVLTATGAHYWVDGSPTNSFIFINILRRVIQII